MRRVLITGGAGFIGSHVSDLLLARGYEVVALDDLSPQVHPDGGRPAYLDPAVELVRGDIRDEASVRQAVGNVDAVIHLAARVGVGQSMYEIARYTEVNDYGTAVLLDALAQHRVERLIVASSMSVYGEGLARDVSGRAVEPRERSSERLRRGEFEVAAEDGSALTSAPTPESKQPSLSSIYALNKYFQERACLLCGRAYGIPTVALRLFNVFGPRQALSNPYTGVIAIFASRILNRRRPMVFEDGQQRRDFVHVRDVARACVAALESPTAVGQVVNTASGVARTIESVARDLARALGRPGIEPEITWRYRAGDIRHCIADTTLARDRLGFVAEEAWEPALVELAEWLQDRIPIDRVEAATEELTARGLVA